MKERQRRSSVVRAIVAAVSMFVLSAPGFIVASGLGNQPVDAPQKKAPVTRVPGRGSAKHEPLRPTIPGADRYQPGKVFLEHADQLYYQESQGMGADAQYQVLVGNVKLRRNDMFMYCDSARFYESSNSLDAFGNVRMQQGDTLFVYADELNYNGQNEMAILYADYGKVSHSRRFEVKAA